MTSIDHILDELDETIRKTDAEFHQVLRPGADNASIEKLRELIPEVTPQLEQWFRWHDGSNEEPGLYPDSGICQISIQEAIEAIKAYSFKESQVASALESTFVCPLTFDGSGWFELFVATDAGANVVVYDGGEVFPEKARPFQAWLEGLLNAWKEESNLLRVDFGRITRLFTGWQDLQLPTKGKKRFLQLIKQLDRTPCIKVIAGGFRFEFRLHEVPGVVVGEEEEDEEGWRIRRVHVVLTKTGWSALSTLGENGESSTVLDDSLEWKLSFCDR